jgi:hypothetical protein
MGYGPQGGGFASAIAAQYSHDALFGNLQGDTLQHQDDMVVNNFNTTDIQYNFFITHGLCLYDQMKVSCFEAFI